MIKRGYRGGVVLRAQRADTVGTDARARVDVDDGPISGN